MLSPKAEEATGILFPRLCNGMTLAGCGVRVKWGFVKVRCWFDGFDSVRWARVTFGLWSYILCIFCLISMTSVIDFRLALA